MAKIKPKNSFFILIFILILSIAGAGSTIFFAQSEINKEVAEINKIAFQVKSSENNGKRLSAIKKQMEEIKDIPPILEKMTATKDNNKYQEKIIKTIRDYAKKSKMKVNRISFKQNRKSKTGNTVPISISLSSPVHYNNLLKFFKLTENGLLRMQITDFSITKVEKEDSKNKVNIGEINVKVYVK